MTCCLTLTKLTNVVLFLTTSTTTKDSINLCTTKHQMSMLQVINIYRKENCTVCRGPAHRRLYWFDWYQTHGKGISLTCRHFGISRNTFYHWKKVFKPYNLQTLEDDTSNRRPHKLREMTTDIKILKRIYNIRHDDLEKSKWEIHEELLREGTKVAHNVIQRIINRHPELLNTQHRKKLKAHRNLKIARIKAARELKTKALGSLVMIDTKHLYVLGVRFYLFVAIDCKSRYGYVWSYKTGSS